MTGPPVTYATVDLRIEHPIDAVWRQIAAFGGLQHWAAGVSDCVVDGAGLGAVRTVTANGYVVRERLEAIDHSEHMIRYHILPPHRLPAYNVHGNVLLRSLGDGMTGIVWRSDATEFEVAPDALGARITQFYTNSIAGLVRLLDAET